MSVLQVGNLILKKQDEIEQHVLSYYEGLFATDNNCVSNGLIDAVIPSLVTNEDNQMLASMPSQEEVKAAVSGMNSHGAAGLDGFGAYFYQKFWSIIEEDVYRSVFQFFNQGWILPNLNSNVIVLIPKSVGADKIEDFRPIALANFQFKIITKVQADRLASIAPKIISENQRGFIRSRKIQDCVCIASEAINLMDKKTFGGNLPIKLDVKKAFDTIDWNLLLKVLNSFGFNDTFCN